MTLIEKLVAIAVIAILASILLASLGRTFVAARQWIWGAYGLNERRIEAALQGNDKLLESALSSKTEKQSMPPRK